MDCFKVSGGRPLFGEVAASGSKNATLPLLAAGLLLEGEAQLSLVPELRDIDTICELLEELGMRFKRRGEALHHQVVENSVTIAPYDIVRRMRASICVLGPLLAKRGAAVVSLPGGCVFGLRPVDLHVRGLQALGAEIVQEHGSLIGKAPAGGLRGAVIDLRSAFGSTVLGTINVMLGAVLAKGTSVIRSAAREPEVVEVANYLNACGAQIEGAGGERIEIQGVNNLKAVPWRVPADRIETGTLLLAGAITRGKVRVNHCRPWELEDLLIRMRNSGLKIKQDDNWIEVDARNGELHASNCETAPFPGFPTDLQAQWMAYSTQVQGTSRIADKVYPERFMHVPELQRLGARLERKADTTLVHGPCPLTGAPVLASDLRASASLVLAGLVAQGETTVRRVYHLDRGYQCLEGKLRGLGARVERQVDDSKP
ncbi:MAG: UDP-N-acetylglucosamine 1-carboxyvinyltransferase [Planctomycetota bacterium]|jgi:UDP-N-acetylglucosamine 1-carboxyvinyltransferase|nr:UDP-N-acetylglucosamine 1-carboxyvinyltransferase [Planctomycetota bacterium]